MIGAQLVIVDIEQKKVILESYNVKVPIEIKFCFDSANVITRLLNVRKTNFIPPHLILLDINHFHRIPAD